MKTYIIECDNCGRKIGLRNYYITIGEQFTIYTYDGEKYNPVVQLKGIGLQKGFDKDGETYDFCSITCFLEYLFTNENCLPYMDYEENRKKLWEIVKKELREL